MYHRITPIANELMARRAWLDRVDIPGANIHAYPYYGWRSSSVSS
jgi:hypothetical protein